MLECVMRNRRENEGTRHLDVKYIDSLGLFETACMSSEAVASHAAWLPAVTFQAAKFWHLWAYVCVNEARCSPLVP